jgi:hypothetical protein
LISIEKDDVIFYNGSYDDFMVARQQDMETRGSHRQGTGT